MSGFNETQLTDILVKCANNPNYKVGAVFTERERQADFIKTMKIAGEENNWSVNVRKGTVRFRNGSEITVIPGTSDSHCGRRFNAILFDGDISEDLQRYVYEPMLAPYMVAQPIEDDDADESLNNFLNEFAVTE